MATKAGRRTGSVFPNAAATFRARLPKTLKLQQRPMHGTRKRHLTYDHRSAVIGDLVADGLARRNGKTVEITDDGRAVLAMREAAIRDAKVLVPVVPRGKPWRPGRRGTGAGTMYPSKADVEAWAKDLDRNEDGEFSSPELTAW